MTKTRSQLGISRAFVTGCVSAIAIGGALQAGAGNGVGYDMSPDVFGGYASTEILIKVTPAAHKSMNFAPTGNVLIAPDVDAALQLWGVQGIQPTLGVTATNTDAAKDIGLDRWYILDVPKGTDTILMASYFSAFGEIEIAEVSGIGGVALTPNDPSFGEQYSLHNTGQNIQGQSGIADADIDAVEAWDFHTGLGTSITVAVVDSGVDDHPDFTGRKLVGWNVVENNDNTGDGCPHATHVSGIIAAEGNNGIGVAGVHWGATILPVRVLTGCNGSTTQCADGIIWATDNGASIANMSLQYYSFSQFFEDSTDYALANDVLLIAAAGNNQGGTVAWPAKFPNCMAVSATDNRDNLAWFSNYGAELDVSAPGQDVYNTWVGNSYTHLSGTSMASPTVAGLAALIRTSEPGLSATQVRARIVSSVDDLGNAGWDNRYGWGRINALYALTSAGPPMDLTATQFHAGLWAVMTAEGATPAETVYFIYSTSGTGSTYVSQLDVTLDLNAPTLAGSDVADGTGEAVFSALVPNGSAGVTLWLQAAENGNTSNVLQDVIH